MKKAGSVLFKDLSLFFKDLDLFAKLLGLFRKTLRSFSMLGVSRYEGYKFISIK